MPAPAEGGRAAPRDLYSRFIPREELSSFESWSFGDVSAGGARGRRARGRGAARSGRAARAAAARGAPVGLPGRLSRRPGRARRLQAELRQPDDDAGRRARALGRRAARRAPAGDGARPRRDRRPRWPARCCAASSRRAPKCVTQVAEQALDALLLSARHIVLRVHPDDHALDRAARPRRSPRAARAWSPTRRSGAAAAGSNPTSAWSMRPSTNAGAARSRRSAATCHGRTRPPTLPSSPAREGSRRWLTRRSFAPPGRQGPAAPAHRR